MPTQLTAIKLRNFRAFQDEIEITVRPITVLIGRNSAGKSSLIKFLLMLRQTLESHSGDFFVTEGRHVQLGTWRDLKNNNAAHKTAQACEFTLTYESDDLPPADVQAFWQATTQGLLVNRQGGREGMRVNLSAEFDVPNTAQTRPLARFDVTGAVNYHNTRGHHAVQVVMEGRTVFKKAVTDLRHTSFLNFSRSDSLDDLIRAAISERYLIPLRAEILGQRHLSPVRQESQQTVQTGSPPPGDVGHMGEYAIPHLARLLSSGEPADQLRVEFIQRFAMSVAGVGELRQTRQSALASVLKHLKGRNEATGAINSLADFGFGVSQCLPIFIQGVMHQPYQRLLVEQPEAQLHPTAQLEMGAFFADLWREWRVPGIIETHSANIILRLRRLIREKKTCPRGSQHHVFHRRTTARLSHRCDQTH